MPIHFTSLFLAAVFVCQTPCVAPAQSDSAEPEQPARRVEEFHVAGNRAFLMLPDGVATPRSLPWVWYAPTLRGLPSRAEDWMLDQFLAAGIAIAGVDCGESYGSPAGRLAYTALYDHLVSKRGLAARVCLLARSRGGLMLYNWAVENPQRIAGIAGIYPVCDLTSYPGLAKACGAYGMTESRLQSVLRQHNPIDRLIPLAKAGVPIYHIHGDKDLVVPLTRNSGALKARYIRYGGTITLETVAGQGHSMWPGFFESQALVDFVISRARTTKGVIDPDAVSMPANAVMQIGPKESLLVAEKDDVESQWTFRDGVLTASPAWDSVITKQAYQDFCMHLEFNVNDSQDKNPEANGNSGVYIQQRYEVQILDSFGVAAEEYKDSYCGSLYRLKKPDQFVCKKPGEWQVYDIAFRAPVFVGKKKASSARITVYQNGRLIHDDYEIPRKTGAGQNEGPDPQPIKLQGHHNQVRFRNFWIAPLN